MIREEKKENISKKSCLSLLMRYIEMKMEYDRVIPNIHRDRLRMKK